MAYELLPGIWQDAARVLSKGREIEVGQGNLAVQGTRGLLWRDDRDLNKGYIGLKSGLSREARLRNFLHECAHARKHWFNIKPGLNKRSVEKMNRDIRKRGQYPTGEERQRESNADSLADSWNLCGKSFENKKPAGNSHELDDVLWDERRLFWLIEIQALIDEEIHEVEPKRFKARERARSQLNKRGGYVW